MNAARSLPTAGEPASFSDPCPDIVAIPGLNGETLAPGASAVVVYRWSRALRLVSWQLFCMNGSRADSAKLAVRMFADERAELVTDSENVAALAHFLPSAPAVDQTPLMPLSGVGYMPSWAPFGRIVRRGEVWRFQISNGVGASRQIAFAFTVEAP